MLGILFQCIVVVGVDVPVQDSMTEFRSLRSNALSPGRTDVSEDYLLLSLAWKVKAKPASTMWLFQRM